MADKLTNKQAAFVKEYLIDLNATQAYLRAGYKVSENVAAVNGNRLLSIAKIQVAVQKEMDKRAAKVELTAEGVLRDIKTIKERCMQIEPVLDKEGEPIGQFTFDAKNALRACELEGKHLKLFTDRTEVTGKDGGPITVKFEGELEEWSR